MSTIVKQEDCWQPFKIATAYVHCIINREPLHTEDGPALNSQYYLPAVRTHRMKLASSTALKTLKV